MSVILHAVDSELTAATAYRRTILSKLVYSSHQLVEIAQVCSLFIYFFNVEIYCVITTALWSRDGSAVVSLHLCVGVQRLLAALPPQLGKSSNPKPQLRNLPLIVL